MGIHARLERAPYNDAADVTPHDSNVLAAIPQAIYVGGAGDLVVRFYASQTTITFKAVPVGTILPIEVDLVKSTNTTATQIRALYAKE